MPNKRFIQLILVILFAALLTGCGLFPPDNGGDDPPANDNDNPPANDNDNDNPGYPGDNDNDNDNDDNGGGDPPPTGFTMMPLGEPTLIPPVEMGSIIMGETVEHTVIEGEWLMQIARCYGANYTAVKRANPFIYNPNRIMPGIKLTVPNAGSDGAIYERPCIQEVTVQPGETWYGLAQKYKTTPTILRKANPGFLWAGRKIWVPTDKEEMQHDPNPAQTLLFSRDGDLAMWQKEGGETAVYDTLNGHIVEIAVNDSATWALARVVQASGQAADIVLINLVDKTFGTVEANLPLSTISGNNTTLLITEENAAYFVQRDPQFELVTFSIANPLALSKLPNLSHNFPADGAPLLMLFEGTTANQFMLFDPSGLYQYTYGFADGEQVLWQPQADQQLGAYLSPISWSPAGQYLLLFVGHFEGFSYGVFDSSTNQWLPIQNSGGYVMSGTAVWQQDGKLDIINPLVDGETTFSLSTYQPETADGVFKLTQLSQVGLTSPLTNSFGGIHIRSAPTNDGETYLSVQVSDQDGDTHRFLHLDRANNSLVEHMTVDRFIFQATYADSGNLLLMQQINNSSSVDEIIYVDLANKIAFSVLEPFGLDAGNFHWIDSP